MLIGAVGASALSLFAGKAGAARMDSAPSGATPTASAELMKKPIGPVPPGLEKYVVRTDQERAAQSQEVDQRPMTGWNGVLVVHSATKIPGELWLTDTPTDYSIGHAHFVGDSNFSKHPYKLKSGTNYIFYKPDLFTMKFGNQVRTFVRAYNAGDFKVTVFDLTFAEQIGAVDSYSIDGKKPATFNDKKRGNDLPVWNNLFVPTGDRVDGIHSFQFGVPVQGTDHEAKIYTLTPSKVLPPVRH